MTKVAEEILRRGTADYVSMVEVENCVFNRGVSEVAVAREAAESAVREVVLDGLAVLGYPNAAAGGFLAWPGSPSDTLARLTREWDEADPDDNGDFIAWLSLTATGKGLGLRLVMEDDQREEQIMLAMVKLWPGLAGSLNLASSTDRRRLRLSSLATEIVYGRAPEFRPALPPHALRLVLSGADDLYEGADERAREVFERFVRACAIPLTSETVDLVTAKLGPRLRERLKDHLRVRTEISRGLSP